MTRDAGRRWGFRRINKIRYRRATQGVHRENVIRHATPETEFHQFGQSTSVFKFFRLIGWIDSAHTDGRDVVDEPACHRIPRGADCVVCRGNDPHQIGV